MYFCSRQNPEESSVHLSVQPWSDPQAILLRIEVKEKSGGHADDLFFVTQADLYAMCDWLEAVWADDTPPFSLPNTPFGFEFSHREHIGERFIHVIYKKKLICTDTIGGLERDNLEEELLEAHREAREVKDE